MKTIKHRLNLFIEAKVDWLTPPANKEEEIRRKEIDYRLQHHALSLRAVLQNFLDELSRAS